MVNATDKQIHYIECLAIDLGMDRKNRNWAIEGILDHPVRFLDELTMSEASDVIEDFKTRKGDSE